jgi:hypothetical protein
MATKKRSTMAKLERALMKDIDEREAKEDAKSSVGKTLFPFDGVTAKSALRKASDANIDGEYENLRAYKQGIEDSLSGRDRDLRSIEKYGDDAMRSKKFGSRETKKMNMGGKVAGYKNGGCVMSGRGGKYKGAM